MKNLIRKIIAVCSAVFCFFATKLTVYADFGSSTLATGTIRLFGDLTTWLLILAPVAGAVCVVYFFVRRSAADEQDEKKWNNRIKIAVVSTIGAVLATSLISVLLSYYA